MIFKNSLNYLSQFFFFFSNKIRNFYLNSDIYNKKISKISDKNLTVHYLDTCKTRSQAWDFGLVTFSE